MPKYDGTGPCGRGPQTGRGMGSCGGRALPEAMPAARGARRGGCCGFRRFRSAKNELSALEEEENMLKEELKAIEEEKRALGSEK